MSKITPSVYKIDLEKLLNHIRRIDAQEQIASTSTSLIESSDAHKAIKLIQDFNHEQGLTKAKPFALLENGVQIVGSAEIAVYGKKFIGSHEWQELFEQEIGDLQVKRQNLAAFIVIDSKCYAISAGTGYTMFEQFIDTSFPLEIARRIMNPEVDGTSERAINGAIYGRIQQFRNSQLVISSQNLGTVWQGIQGRVNDRFQQSPGFAKLFDSYASKTGLEAGSSLKIRRSMSIKRIVDLIIWLENQLTIEPSGQQKEAFKFLDSLSEVSPRKYKSLISDLETQLAKDIYEQLKNGKETHDYDFCHKAMDLYLSADIYMFQDELLEAAKHFDDNFPPSAYEVLKSTYDTTTPKNVDEFLETIKKQFFISVHEGDERDTRRASIINHVNGEVQLNGKCYFLIDQKWYTASGSFVDRVKSDFKGLVESDFFERSDCGLKKYEHAKESEYNESYIQDEGWLVADRAFLSNVEIADIFHFKDDSLYIVHNKIGFDVKIRDVCSQILHSMNIINQVRSGGDKKSLEEYYDKIVDMSYYSDITPKITKTDFVDRILKTDSKKITYILGYTTNLSDLTRSKSNIAKFETVKLCRVDKRAFDFELKVVDIRAIKK